MLSVHGVRFCRCRVEEVVFFRCLQRSLFLSSPPDSDYNFFQCLLLHKSVPSIPAALMACPKLPKSLIHGKFTSSCSKAAESAMGPYFLSITANRRWADSSKVFSGAIDQRWALCLSCLTGDMDVTLLESPLTVRIQTWIQCWFVEHN